MKKAVLTALASIMVFMTAAEAKKVDVKGYTKKDGTVVAGYTKEVKDPDTVKVKGYTKKDGTKVKGYTRKKNEKTATF